MDLGTIMGGVCLGGLVVAAVLGILLLRYMLPVPNIDLREPGHRVFAPPLSGFGVKYPYWCPHCRVFVREQNIREKVDGDSDDGYYVAQLHDLCGTQINQIHLLNPRGLFAAIMAGSAEYASRDARAQAAAVDSFLLAYSDFKSGQMTAEEAAEFEQALAVPERLLKILADDKYQFKW
jgi:hypothetical protein